MNHVSEPRVPWLLMSALLAVSALLLAATVCQIPAFATPSTCHAATCDGLDPQATACGHDAHSLDSLRYQGSQFGLQGALLELRHSSACSAAWIRVTDADCQPQWRPCGFVLEVQDGTKQSGGSPGRGQRWTHMWSLAQPVRGCFITVNGDGTYTRDGCTAWH